MTGGLEARINEGYALPSHPVCSLMTRYVLTNLKQRIKSFSGSTAAGVSGTCPLDTIQHPRPR